MQNPFASARRTLIDHPDISFDAVTAIQVRSKSGVAVGSYTRFSCQSGCQLVSGLAHKGASHVRALRRRVP